MTEPEIGAEEGTPANLDVLPIFLCEEEPEPSQGITILAFRGTGFRFANRKDLLVTCWHCLAEPEPERGGYAVGTQDRDSRRSRIRSSQPGSTSGNGFSDRPAPRRRRGASGLILNHPWRGCAPEVCIAPGWEHGFLVSGFCLSRGG